MDARQDKHPWLHREVTRHTLGSAIPALLGLGLLGVFRALDDATAAQHLLDALVPLTFGLYGPAYLWLSRVAFQNLSGIALQSRVRRSEERSKLMRLLYLGGPVSWAILVAGIGVASVVLLATQGSVSLLVVASAIIGVAGTWVLLVGIFAVEHMRGWAARGGFDFPGDQDRTFDDFIYLSVQVSTTFASSDVALTNQPARRLVTVQSVAAFAYNAIVIAVFASLLVSSAG